MDSFTIQKLQFRLHLAEMGKKESVLVFSCFDLTLLRFEPLMSLTLIPTLTTDSLDSHVSPDIILHSLL